MFSNTNLERLVTAVIALVLILASISIAVVGALRVGSPSDPQWLLSSTTLVIGYYFGNHRASLGSGGTTITNTNSVPPQPLSAGKTTTASG